MLGVTMIAAIVAGVAFKFSDLLLDWLGFDEEKQENIKRIGVDIHNPPMNYDVQLKSPFKENHFVEINGEKVARYTTIYNFMEWIEFKLSRPPYVNKYVTNYVVRGEFISRTEYTYDVNWTEGLGIYTCNTQIVMEKFSEEERNSPDFPIFLEFHCMVDVWNNYHRKYPMLFPYPAYIGESKEEHSLLK